MAPTEQAQSGLWIPNITIGEDYDQRYRDASIHYDRLGRFADFFGWDMPVHRHARFLQIHFIESGHIDFQIDNRHYQLEGPALFLTPAAVPHSFRIAPNAGGHVLTIQHSILWQLLHRGLQDDAGMRLEQGLCLTPSALDAQQRSQWHLLCTLLDRLALEWRGDQPARNVAIENLVDLILILVGRLGEQTTASSDIKNEDLQLFHRFSETVEAHFRDHRRLDAYARDLGVSESRLNATCKRISGCAPKQLINERLLSEAKRLLSLSERSGSEIAYALGFSDPAYFSRFFKRLTGLPPAQYRSEQHQN